MEGYASPVHAGMLRKHEERPSKEGHKADALALGADERRDKLR